MSVSGWNGWSSVCCTAEYPCDTDGGCQSRSAPFLTPAAAQVAAGLWHLISMACQLKANVPTGRPLYVALLQILTGLSYCLLSEPKAICIWEVEQGVPVWTITVACERMYAVCGGEEGKRRKDQERSPVCLPVNRWRAEEREWEERWRHTEKRWLKDLAAFCQATTATFHPPCSLSTWLREREVEIKVKTHTSS